VEVFSCRCQSTNMAVTRASQESRAGVHRDLGVGLCSLSPDRGRVQRAAWLATWRGESGSVCSVLLSMFETLEWWRAGIIGRGSSFDDFSASDTRERRSRSGLGYSVEYPSVRYHRPRVELSSFRC
jgi:hypothetical protein